LSPHARLRLARLVVDHGWPQPLLANAETRIVYRQESDQLGATSAALGLTGTEQSLIPTLGTGQGLWRIKHRSFAVQHQMHPAELELFDTTGRMTGNPNGFTASGAKISGTRG